jgi:hypothetical protein
VNRVFQHSEPVVNLLDYHHVVAMTESEKSDFKV